MCSESMAVITALLLQFLVMNLLSPGVMPKVVTAVGRRMSSKTCSRSRVQAKLLLPFLAVDPL